ncbi:MAG TPA: DUF3089 domain-containing protein [Caulobacteraceae bacterium]|nr:DUF3089 domain-containing protein [Caulobacteraceae bacterium]
MFRTFGLAASFLAAALALTAAPALAQPAAAASPAARPPPMPASTAPNDYANRANWLCWPGRDDACASDLTATQVAPDGATRIQRFRPDPHPAIDCFYVYPTVSTEPTRFSDMKIQPQETNVVIQQAARLRAHCRLFAPMYRQGTLTALIYYQTHRRAPGAAPPPPAPALNYDDVRDAWNYYLAHENHGRGVVLVGHSQGSGLLAELIRNEIDAKPAQRRLVSAILMGATLNVPAGKAVGGDFKSIPLCRSDAQTGCAIAYSSFRATDLPPPANTFFGRPRKDGAGLEAACVNPASLAGGAGLAKPYFGVAPIAGQAQRFQWVKGKTIATPFVEPVGMLTATCVHSGPFHLLAIRIIPAAGPRAQDIPGDLIFGGMVQKNWGLHLIDANLFMGNLVDIVGDESRAWTAKGGK